MVHLAERSGPTRSLEPALRWLGREGEIEVLVPGGGQAARDLARYGAVTPVQYTALTLPRGISAAAAMTRRAAQDVRRLRAEIRRRRPDLVVILTSVLPSVLLAARLERIPAIVTVEELWTGRSVTGSNRAIPAKALLRLTETLASAVVCRTRTVADQFGGRRAPVFIAYPPISANGGGDRRSFREKHDLAAADPLIAVVGNLTVGRGQDLAIMAMPAILERNPGAICVLVGQPHPRAVDQEYAARLPGLAAAFGVDHQVRFIGFIPEIQDLFAACDLVVNPARIENFGRVACEALLAGLPVVSTRAGAITEILRDTRDALLVDVDDQDGLASAVNQILADRDLAKRLVDSGRASVLNRYTDEQSVDGFAAAVGAALPGAIAVSTASPPAR